MAARPPNRPGTAPFSERRKTEPRLSAVPEPISWEPTPPPVSLWEARVEEKLDTISEELTKVRVSSGELRVSHDNLLTAVRASSSILEGVRAGQVGFEKEFSWFLVKDWPRTQTTLEQVEKHLAERKTGQALLEQDAGGQAALIQELREKAERSDARHAKAETALEVQHELTLEARRRGHRNLAIAGAAITVIEIIVSILLH